MGFKRPEVRIFSLGPSKTSWKSILPACFLRFLRLSKRKSSDLRALGAAEFSDWLCVFSSNQSNFFALLLLRLLLDFWLLAWCWCSGKRFLNLIVNTVRDRVNWNDGARDLLILALIDFVISVFCLCREERFQCAGIVKNSIVLYRNGMTYGSCRFLFLQFVQIRILTNLRINSSKFWFCRSCCSVLWRNVSVSVFKVCCASSALVLITADFSSPRILAALSSQILTERMPSTRIRLSTLWRLIFLWNNQNNSEFSIFETDYYMYRHLVSKTCVRVGRNEPENVGR